MANSLSVNQISTILNSIVEQATGQKQITPTNTCEFVTVAQVGLLAGDENLMNAVSQVLSRTIFSVRPYSRKFKGLESDSIMWGNHVRKINYLDGEWQDNEYLPITDGVAVDDQKPVKPKVVQTNFYGQNDYEIQWTIFREQLHTAFKSPDELGSFIAGQLQNISDRTEQKHEALSRMVLANLIGGIIEIGNSDQKIHLLTEYNTATGLELTATSVYQPENFAPFMRWVYGRINTLCYYMSERTEIYHQNLATGAIMRHTPAQDLRVYIYAPAQFNTEANVLSTTYNDKYLKLAVTEPVSFWQSIKTPDSIHVKPTYMGTDGKLVTPQSAKLTDNIFGLIMDKEAAGYTICNQRSTSAPYNGAGEYQNFWQKFTDRYWNDFTENAVVLLLD